MFRIRPLYAVPAWMRLLTAGAATIVAVSLPLLVGSASNLQLSLIVAAGTFALSIALFGRAPRAGAPNNSFKPNLLRKSA